MRRTRESITNEYNKFKGLKAEITKLKAFPDYEKLDVIRQIKCGLIPQIKNDFLRYAEAL